MFGYFDEKRTMWIIDNDAEFVIERIACAAHRF